MSIPALPPVTVHVTLAPATAGDGTHETDGGAETDGAAGAADTNVAPLVITRFAPLVATATHRPFPYATERQKLS